MARVHEVYLSWAYFAFTSLGGACCVQSFLHSFADTALMESTSEELACLECSHFQEALSFNLTNAIVTTPETREFYHCLRATWTSKAFSLVALLHTLSLLSFALALPVKIIPMYFLFELQHFLQWGMI